MFNKKYDFKIIIQEEGKIFTACVPAVPGCHAQGDTYEQAQKNIKEALELCLEESKSNKWYAQRISFPAETKRESSFSILNLPVKIAFK